MTLVLVNETTGTVLARHLSLALGLASRFLGLIGGTDLPADSALALSHCDWVHSFLVRFPLDVVYCDREGRVLRIVKNLKPNRIAAPARGAYWAYEMHSGRLAPYVSPGDCLRASSEIKDITRAALAMTSGGA